MSKRPDLAARNRSRRASFKYEDVDWMRSGYVERGLTLRQLAVEAECSLRTIARWMEIHGIPTDRSRIGANAQRGEAHYNWQGGPAPCPLCGGPKTHYATTCMTCHDKSGTNNPRWLGDDITSSTAAHTRVRAVRGRAAEYICELCDRPAAGWAYDHADPDEHQHTEGPFSLDPWHYIPMCTACHKRFDLGYLASVTA